MSYHDFINKKLHEGADCGFEPNFMPSCLMDFQAAMVDWAVQKGRGAMFEDCGMGKTLQSLTWAQNVAPMQYEAHAMGYELAHDEKAERVRQLKAELAALEAAA